MRNNEVTLLSFATKFQKSKDNECTNLQTLPPTKYISSANSQRGERDETRDLGVKTVS